MQQDRLLISSRISKVPDYTSHLEFVPMNCLPQLHINRVEEKLILSIATYTAEFRKGVFY